MTARRLAIATLVSLGVAACSHTYPMMRRDLPRLAAYRDGGLIVEGRPVTDANAPELRILAAAWCEIRVRLSQVRLEGEKLVVTQPPLWFARARAPIVIPVGQIRALALVVREPVRPSFGIGLLTTVDALGATYALRLAAYPAPWLVFDLDVGGEVTAGLKLRPFEWQAMRPFVEPIAGIDLDSRHRGRWGGRVGVDAPAFRHLSSSIFLEAYHRDGWHANVGVVATIIW